MNQQLKSHHILIIEGEHDSRSVVLESATISLGRDPTNAIVLDSKAISRQHAILLRLPLPKGAGYRYRLLDGNSAGRVSTNGITINGKRCSSHDLEHGDQIIFGGQIKAHYQIVPLDQTQSLKDQNIKSLDFQSIQLPPFNAQDTLADEDSDPLTALFCGNTPKFWGVVNQPDHQPQNQRFHGGDS